ncbi:MAG: PLP-dependent aminotransferase family protein [Clostridiales bacterium]|nr:PLP-dependent aminotransferase family protein [Clostridiales bacterium]
MPINSFDDYPMSWRPMRPTDEKPLYLALAAQLERDILDGTLLPGTRLPPQRELADFLDINVSTVTRAFRLCRQKGLLSGTVGSGTFVAYDARASLSVMPQNPGCRLLEMGSVMPPPVPFGAAADLLHKMIQEPDFHRLLGYGALEAAPWHREAAVRLMAQAGFAALPELLLAANGGQNAIAATLAGLFRPGDCIGADPLTYPGLKSAASLLGIELVPVAQKDRELSEAGLQYACKNHRIKGLFVMPDHQNPTTHTMSPACRAMIARLAARYDLIVIEDAIHSLMLPRPQPAIASLAPEHTVYLFSLSKAVSPGFRFSYAVPPWRYFGRLKEALYSLNLTVSPLLQEFASRLIASGRALEIAKQERDQAIRRNGIADAQLQSWTLLGGPTCIFRWLLLPEGWTGEAFEAAARERGVQVYGAQRFAVGKARPEPAVRLAMTAIEEEAAFVRGLGILRSILENPSLYCAQF